jgi:hypothetical protein
MFGPIKDHAMMMAEEKLTFLTDQQTLLLA